MVRCSLRIAARRSAESRLVNPPLKMQEDVHQLDRPTCSPFPGVEIPRVPVAPPRNRSASPESAFVGAGTLGRPESQPLPRKCEQPPISRRLPAEYSPSRPMPAWLRAADLRNPAECRVARLMGGLKIETGARTVLGESYALRLNACSPNLLTSFGRLRYTTASPTPPAPPPAARGS